MLEPNIWVRTLVPTEEVFGVGTIPIHSKGYIVDKMQIAAPDHHEMEIKYTVAVMASDELTLYGDYTEDEMLVLPW